MGELRLINGRAHEQLYFLALDLPTPKTMLKSIFSVRLIASHKLTYHILNTLDVIGSCLYCSRKREKIISQNTIIHFLLLMNC